ncbi:MAG: hypothetical protein ABSE70_02015 [Candidatus Limnocylindrales bacterium]
MPPAALAALGSDCGPLPLDSLFVVPRTTRLIGPRQCVLTPAKVLAFGDGAVGLWIDDGPGRVIAIPIDRLMAIDDRQILLHGRLRLIAVEGDLVVRYNTTERADLRDNLAWLRRRVATTSVPTGSGFLWLSRRGEQNDPQRLPFKWRFLLQYSSLLVEPGEEALVAAGDVAEIRGRRSGPASGVAVLASRELAIASEPGEYLEGGRYGVDLLAVPRDRLESLAWDGRFLTVRLARRDTDSGSTSIALPLDRHLIEAMRRVFGAAVAWS